ncbi:hypothetical protein D3C78_1316560 [compost metagenome]
MTGHPGRHAPLHHGLTDTVPARQADILTQLGVGQQQAALERQPARLVQHGGGQVFAAQMGQHPLLGPHYGGAVVIEGVVEIERDGGHRLPAAIKLHVLSSA